MRSKLLFLLYLGLLVVPTASAAPDDSQLAGLTPTELQQQLQLERSAWRSAGREIRRRQADTGRLRRQARAARKKLPGLQRRQARVARRLQRQRERLERATRSYVQWATSLGLSSVQSGGGDAGMLDLLVAHSADPGDAALLYGQGRALLQKQATLLSHLRILAVQTQGREQQVQAALQRQQNTRWQAEQALADNRREIGRLRTEMRQSWDTMQTLRSWMGVWGSRGGGGVLQPGQVLFAQRLAALSGLDVNLIRAWTLAEESDGYARQRQAEGNHNWLNVGYFDSLSGSGAFQGIPVWEDPLSAAEATAAFLEGHFLGASAGIQRIRRTAGQPVGRQLLAIARSGWASSAYGGGSSLRRTYALVPHTEQPPREQVWWTSPRDGRRYRLGD